MPSTSKVTGVTPGFLLKRFTSVTLGLALFVLLDYAVGFVWAVLAVTVILALVLIATCPLARRGYGRLIGHRGGR